jgi:hypothetical protein
MDPRQLQAVLLAAGGRLLQRALGPQAGPVTVIIRNPDGVELRLRGPAPPGAEALLTPPPPAGLLPFLRSTYLGHLERQALRALRDKPLPAHALARRMGCGLSRAKAMLAGLVDRGVLRVARDGYRLADPLLLEVLGDPDPAAAP